MFLGCISVILSSCVTSYKPNKVVSYSSLRPTIIMDESKNPIENASIAVYNYLHESGHLCVIVQNLTDDILTIDQTKSFVVTPSKESKPFYDSTIRTHSTSSATSTGSGMSFNLGGIANVFGMGGLGGSLMSSVNVGTSKSSTTGSTDTKISADLPQVTIGPRGKMTMSKIFEIGLPTGNFASATPETSPYTFSVIISYSFNDGKSYDTIISDFYSSGAMERTVHKSQTNNAIRDIITAKPNATLEPWFILLNSRSNGIKRCPSFINYQ